MFAGVRPGRLPRLVGTPPGAMTFRVPQETGLCGICGHVVRLRREIILLPDPAEAAVCGRERDTSAEIDDVRGTGRQQNQAALASYSECP